MFHRRSPTTTALVCAATQRPTERTRDKYSKQTTCRLHHGAVQMTLFMLIVHGRLPCGLTEVFLCLFCTIRTCV